MKRSTLTGSAVGSAMLALSLLRGSGPSLSPVSPAVSNQAQNVRLLSASTTKLTTAGRQKSPTEDGPWKASQAYFAGTQRNGECPVSSRQERSKKIASLGGDVVLQRAHSREMERYQHTRHSQLWCIPEGERVAAMIAILPDPVETNMPLQFDRMIDALQLAAESSLYVGDRYWLPWEASPRVEYADYASRQAALQDEAKKQKQPGLLLFRRNGTADEEAPSTLYMFLVSDSPTIGVNGTQFANAVAYIGEVCAGESCAHHAITIAGPTFSGSLASLRRLAASQAKQTFHAYSGTISSARALWMQKLAKEPEGEQCWSSNSIRVEAPKNLSVCPLMHDTESAVERLRAWLIRSGEIDKPSATNPCRADLAIFSEAGTTYGSAVDRTCYRVFEYPREISRLRNAYVGQEPSAKLDQGSGNTVLRYLPFNLADRETNRSDKPPDFSRLQGPLSKEAVLMSFAAELRRRHIRYAGIVGSNVLDVIFLENFLRKTCPDVRLFVINADLLFERDLDNSPYIGTLTLTTYPLIPRNLDWIQDGRETKGKHTDGASRSLPLVDQYQEGIYNAALLAIWYSLSNAFRGGAARPELREVQYPFQAQLPSHYDTSELPLWLTAVGYGGYWPVTLLPQASQDSLDAGVPPTLRDEDFSPAWKAVAIISCIFSFWHVAMLVGANWSLSLSIVPKALRRTKYFTANLTLKESPRATSHGLISAFSLLEPARDRRLFFLNMASATLATTLGMLLAPPLRFSNITGWTLKALPISMAVSSAILSGMCFLLEVIRWQAKKTSKLRARTIWLTVGNAGVWVVAFLGIVYWWRLHANDSSHYGFFFAYRSVHLATGVSPFTPMIPLVAGFYCWALFESWRLKFHDNVRPRLRCWRSASGNTDWPSGSVENTIARSINDFALRPIYLVALWLVFIAWCLSLPPTHPFQIFERRSYGVLYEIVFCLLVFLMLCSGFRLGQIWSDVKKLLAGLNQSRIRGAFTRVKEPSWSPLWRSGVREREWTNIDRSVEVLEQIAACEPRPNERFKTALTQLRTFIDGEREGESSLPRALQQRLTKVLRWARKDLEDYWLTTGGLQGETIDSGDKDKQMVVCSERKELDGYSRQMHRLEEFVALRYVAFLGGVLYQIRLLIIIVATLFTLILLSLNIYSFEPHQSLIWSFTAIFAVIGFFVIKVLFEVHRDYVLSRITGTEPNELGMDFYLRVAIFGAGPLVTLLATHFPAIGGYLFSLLQPGLEAVK